MSNNGFVFQDLNITSNDKLYRAHPFQDAFPRNRLLVWLTYWCDAQRHGPNAKAWRRTNMAFHLLAAGLVAILSLPAAVLFAVHPLAAMGHRYVAGRSGVMSALFQLAIVLLTLYGFWWIAVLLAIMAIRWVKEDSVIWLPMIFLLAVL